MSLPSGFDPVHYLDVPMVYAGPATRRALRRLQQKAWAGKHTARIAIAGDSVLETVHVSRLNRICGQIFGNTPETQWFGTATGSKPSPADWSWRIIDQRFQLGDWTWRSDVIPDPQVIPWPLRSGSEQPDLCVDSDWAADVRTHALNGAPDRAAHYGEPAFWCDLADGITIDAAVWGPPGEPGHDINLETFIRLRLGNHGSSTDIGSVAAVKDPAPAPEGATVYQVNATPSMDTVDGWTFEQAKRYQLMLETRVYFRPRNGDAVQDVKLARVGVRQRFSNPLGMVFHHLSKGGKRLDEWLDDNSTAMPLWYEPLGPFDCVVQAHALNTDAGPTHDAFYDQLHAFVDLWRAINPQMLIWISRHTIRGGRSVA